MGFACGIVGLPNVGKSTLFNALTASKVEASNYPFCTIDPNTGIVKVPDPRLKEISSRIVSDTLIPASMTFVDIAGLVKGASKGEGLGNQFLGHIRETQAIAHVVRCFDDPNVVHVDGSVDPLRDVEVIETELMLADLESVEKRMNQLRRQKKPGQDKQSAALLAVLEPVQETLAAGRSVRTMSLDPESLLLLRECHLITAKPQLYVANVDENALVNSNDALKSLEALAKKEDSPLVVICANMEAEIAQLEPEERMSFLESMGLKEPGLDRLIRAGYKLLGLQTFFTAGKVETRAWTFSRGVKAPQAAGVIHTDFEKGFIKAEVFTTDDLIRLGSEQAIKDAGLFRLEGKDYTVLDGDIMHFRFAL